MTLFIKTENNSDSMDQIHRDFTISSFNYSFVNAYYFTWVEDSKSQNLGQEKSVYDYGCLACHTLAINKTKNWALVHERELSVF